MVTSGKALLTRSDGNPYNHAVRSVRLVQGALPNEANSVRFVGRQSAKSSESQQP
jgi:hypothetical protein